jgi:hypothetical protein
MHYFYFSAFYGEALIGFFPTTCCKNPKVSAPAGMRKIGKGAGGTPQVFK